MNDKIAFEEGDNGSVPVPYEEFKWDVVEAELGELPEDLKADARQALARALFMFACLLKQQRHPKMILDLLLYNIGSTSDTFEAIATRCGVKKQAVNKENDKLVASLFKGKARR